MYDSTRDFRERVFLLITMIGEVSVFLVLMCDILLGENIVEIAVLAGTVIIAPVISYICLHSNGLKKGSIIIAVSVVFIIMPVTFFFGGGMYGGAVIWFSFAFLYIGLLLRGKWRNIMMVLLSLLAVVEYYVGYYHPELIVQHTNRMFYLDSIASVLLIGFVIYITVWFLNRIYLYENNRAKEEALKVEKLSDMQNRFFSNMSHEIRTPINTIIGLNEMILRENISDEVAEDAQNIGAASKMLLHLINDILDMSKLSAGQMQITAAPYMTGDMLSELVGMLWIRAKEKGLELHVNVAPELPAELTGDEMRIKQILINVLTNAIKYTKEGTVSLSIQCGEKNGNTVSVIYTVTDTGMGIRKEDIPYLFSAFKRVDEQKNRHIEGTGLGLSIVKQLVDLMGGRITVNSVYTKGSSFIIEIPQQIHSEKSIGSVDLNNHVNAQKKQYIKHYEAPDAKVLVVDDSASNLLVVKKLLRETLVKIDTASSGEEALKKTLNSEYHVIFMDHLMPGMDGVECHRNIRSQVGGRCRGAKIVALTANAGGDSRALYEKEGFDGYLTKPISGAELERELYRLLPNDIVFISGNEEEIFEETISWMRSDQKKKNIIITTESVADLPKEIIERYGIAVIPHMVRTDNGVFRDGTEIETDGLLRYMQDHTRRIVTIAPDVRAHEEFFAEQLQKANNVIHISISSKVANSGCHAAAEAAAAFDNVTVIDTGHLSSGQGLIVLEACRLAEAGKTPAEITAAVEELKNKVSTSFVVDNLDFLARAGQVRPGVASMTRSFMARPVLAMKNGSLRVGKVYFGSKEKVRRKYIDHVLHDKKSIDDEVLFVTYVGLNKRELDEIKSYIESRMKFGKIYFYKASSVIAVNCGAGTFGLLLKRR